MIETREFAPGSFTARSWICCGRYVTPEIHGDAVEVTCPRCGQKKRVPLGEGVKMYAITDFQGITLHTARTAQDDKKFRAWVTECNDYASVRIVPV